MVHDYQDPAGSDPIMLQFEKQNITMILPHGNEKDKYYLVQEHLPKRKKDEKKNHILKVNLK